MKKITVLILALGLTMPAHSWTLFPVREKIVEVKENDWLLNIGIIFTSLAVCFLAFEIDKALEKKRIIVKPMEPTDHERWCQQMHYETMILEALNHKFNKAGLTISFNHANVDAHLKVSLSYEDSDSGETEYVRTACLQSMAAEAKKFNSEHPEEPIEEPQIPNREEFFRQFNANKEKEDANSLKTSDDGE